jgi:hypothetical protein
MNVIDQIPIEVSKYEENTKVAKFYQEYKKLSGQYQELIEKGITHPRESRLRSISDPPADAMPLLGIIR